MKPLPAGVEAVQGYACAHCGNRRPLFRSSTSVIRHIKVCIHDPAQRTCVTCEHDWARDCQEGVRPSTVRLARACPSWAPRD